MDIHFVSSLTQDDEHHLASAVTAAIEELLARSALFYTLRIQTSGGQVLEACRLNEPDDQSGAALMPRESRSARSGRT